MSVDISIQLAKINSVLETTIIKMITNHFPSNICKNVDELKNWIEKNPNKLILRKPEQQIRLYLNPEFEMKLLDPLLSVDTIKTVFHYTSLDACFSILQSQEIKITSIVGLNDKSEINFSDLFDVKEPYNQKRIDKYHEKFIFSLSHLRDNLNQWRLYGDDGKGVCLHFRYNTSLDDSHFVYKKIYYGKGYIEFLKELGIAIKKIKNFKFVTSDRFFSYRYFFKNEAYKEEEEIRLMFLNELKNKTSNWYLNRYNIINTCLTFHLNSSNFPLELWGLTLGPKCPHLQLNDAQLRKYIRENPKLRGLKIYKSQIDCYR
ncbi:MAG: DUF2971 domain-containing protein [Saccharofermentanaceae bacterium]|jgi:hypothetical protein|nr:DUF2971 domain-containing protein [Bacteroidales bacterium]